MALTNNELLHELKKMIDEGASGEEVIEHFSDENIYFPKYGINKDEEKAALISDWKMGASMTELLTKYHWSYSSVRRFIREYLDAQIKAKETN